MRVAVAVMVRPRAEAGNLGAKHKRRQLVDRQSAKRERGTRYERFDVL